jgi:hypothetical protein
LTTLSLSGTKVSDAGLAHLAGLDRLIALDLTKTNVTAKGVESLAKALPRCKISSIDPDRRAAEYVLSIGGTVKVNDQARAIKTAADLPRESFQLTFVEAVSRGSLTDAGLVVFKDCKNLKSLDLYGPRHITDAGLAHFKDCKKLELLALHGTSVTDAGLALFKDCQNLKNLNLWGCSQVTDAGWGPFTDRKNVTLLQLGDTKVNDASLARLKDCKKLAVLYLEGTQVTDAGLTYLVGLTELTYLKLTRTKVTAKGVEGLAKALPKCKIEWDGGSGGIEPRVGFAPFTDADVQRIAALPAAQQVEEVRKELMRRNPGFDGKVGHKIEDGAVTEFRIVTDQVTDIAPIRVWSALRLLDCRGTWPYRGLLADLTPLKRRFPRLLIPPQG